MKHDSWKVGGGIRPAGSPNHCFYCGAERGTEHKPGCVCRMQTVVVRATVEYVLAVPEDWDKGMIERSRNQGSWCGSNALKEFQSAANSHSCLCGAIVYEFVREATPEDEKDRHRACPPVAELAELEAKGGPTGALH
jgi:hypothetical protein